MVAFVLTVFPFPDDGQNRITFYRYYVFILEKY